jgi:hypothetical protein
MALWLFDSGTCYYFADKLLDLFEKQYLLEEELACGEDPYPIEGL